jgi:hypothetical protein
MGGGLEGNPQAGQLIGFINNYTSVTGEISGMGAYLNTGMIKSKPGGVINILIGGHHFNYINYVKKNDK